MPVALPAHDHVNLSPPERDEVEFILGGLLSACATEDGDTRLQVLVLTALARAMTGFDVDPTTVDRPSAHEFAEGLARRNDAFRTHMVGVRTSQGSTVRRSPASTAQRRIP